MITFILGVFVGATLGVLAMALCVVARNDEPCQ